MNFKDNQKTFKFMLSNFEIAEKKMPADFKSVHWDVFPNGYVDIIKNEKDLATNAQKCINDRL